MRVLWISFLLFGLAACVPMLKYGSNSGTRLVQPNNHRFRGTSGGGSAQSPGFYQAYSGPSTYQGSAPYYSPDHYAVPSPDGYNAVQPWWNGQPNSGFQSDEGQGPSQELVPKPFYSDVSELDPVSSFSSRSRYQRGNVVFSRTRYIPGEPASFRPVLPQPQLPQQQFPQPLLPQQQFPQPPLPQQQFPQPPLPQQQFPQPPQQPVPRDAAARPRGLVYSYQNYGY